MPLFTRKDLTRLIVPLVIEQLLSVTIGIADTVMVAGCGEASVSAVSLIDSINILLLQVFSALATGGAIICAQYLGGEDRDSAALAAEQLVLVTTVLSLGIMALVLAFCGGIISLIYGTLEPLVLHHAESYFYLTGLSYPFIAVYNVSAALFRARGNAKVSMFTSLVMNIFNIGGNALFIFGFNMDVFGAGLATLLSRIAGAAVMVWLMCHGDGLLAGTDLRRLKYNPAMVRGILRVGIPSGLENSIFQVGKLLVQGLIASFGTMALAANAMANSISGLVSIPGNALGLAMITVVGQCVGAGSYEEARSYINKIMGAAVASAFVMDVILFFAAKPMSSLYGLSPETGALATEILRYYCVFQFTLWPWAFTLPNALRAAGDVRFTMAASVATMWVFRIGFSYFLCGPFQMGLMGVWAAMFIDWGARAALFIWRLLSGRWKNHRVV